MVEALAGLGLLSLAIQGAVLLTLLTLWLLSRIPASIRRWRPWRRSAARRTPTSSGRR